MSKKFFLTLTVLLGVSLFLTGCPTDADSDTPPVPPNWYDALGSGFSVVGDTVTVTEAVTLDEPLSIPAGKMLKIAASGALTVNSGSITVGAGAALVVGASGTLDVTPANGVTVEEGAALTVESGGTLTATEADGVAVAVGAALVVETANDVIIGGVGLAAGVYADIGVVDDSDPPPSLADTLAAALNAVTASSANADGATVTLTGAPTISSGEVIVPLGVTLATSTYMLTIDGGTLTVKGTLDVEASGSVTVSSGTFQGGTSLAKLIVADGATVTGVDNVTMAGNYEWDMTEEEWTLILLDAIPVNARFRVVAINADAARLSVYDDDESDWGPAAWYTVDAAQLAILEAVYEPNKAGSTEDDLLLDADANPSVSKTAVAYNAALSAAVLGLFQFTTDAEGDIEKIELTGTPPAANIVSSSPATTTHLIVIDIGKPGVDNSTAFGDVKFYIPLSGDAAGNKHGTLGADGTTSYDYIRLRVNKGAHLVILADNTNAGTGGSCPPGWFNNGCVEVMAGGKLRDGAYRGFPLGSNAVILNRVDSYLAVGPEDSEGLKAGWLVGPNAVGDDMPRIKWDEGSAGGGTVDHAGYLEVRPDKLAISTDVTLQKGLGLIYSVWLVGNTTITIDVSEANQGTVGRGLFALNGTYKIYGSSDAEIKIKAGSILHTAYLTADDTDLGKGVSHASDEITLTISGSANPMEYVSNITGYRDWTGYESNSENLSD